MHAMLGLLKVTHYLRKLPIDRCPGLTMMLSSYTAGRENNFNLIRFIAAFAVLVSHSYAIHFGSPELEPLHHLLGRSLGSFAVDIFFVTSGFLIYSSLDRRPSLKDYAISRFLRIYPGLFIMILITVFALGPIVTNLSTTDYFLSAQILEYTFKNSILLFRVNYELPGVFSENPLGTAVNGSLWSLPFELYMYITLPIIIISGKHVSRKLKESPEYSILLFLLLISAFRHLVEFNSLFIHKFLVLSELFFSGALIYSIRKSIPINYSYFTASLALALICIANKETSNVIFSLTLSYIIVWISYKPAGIIRRFNNIEDYSYGLYIYAFPIQQTITHFDIAKNVSTHILISFIFTLGFAMLSWKIVEKRALTLKKNLK